MNKTLSLLNVIIWVLLLSSDTAAQLLFKVAALIHCISPYRNTLYYSFYNFLHFFPWANKSNSVDRYFINCRRNLPFRISWWNESNLRYPRYFTNPFSACSL